MLHTYLTRTWGLHYPIIGAPMWGAGRGALARAISQAGGLGIIGVGSTASPSFIEEESAVARGDGSTRFGIGLMVWALERRSELFDAALAARPFLLSLSFGSPEPYVVRAHRAGVLVATQVHSVAEAREAAAAGVDVVVAQGTEAGGHTGRVGTLPLLQMVLDVVEAPVLAAGGIGSARGLAGVLAAGAQGAWIGTAFLASGESVHGADARRRIIAAQETDTVLTSVFDLVQQLPWPSHYPGRALRNRFSERWHPRGEVVGTRREAREEYERARAEANYDIAVIYAGEGVGMVTRERPAAEIVRDIGEGAEEILRRTTISLLGG